MIQDALKKRFLWIHFFLIILVVAVIIQLVHLQLFQKSELIRYAARQHDLLIDLPAKRGNLFDRNGKELATSLKVPSIYAVPRMIPQDERLELSKKLGKILNLPSEQVYAKLNSRKAFAWLKRRTTPEELKAIQALEDPAFGYIFENKRFYPHQELAAQVMGFVNIDGEGMEGVELKYDKYLKGESGYRLTVRDALGRDINALDKKAVEPVDGADVVLTIDHYIQYLTEKALDEAFVKWKALGAMAVVMNPMTGEILAMASRPTFNPQEPAKYPTEARRNRNITDFYEPGSAFKIVTASGALNEGTVERTETFFCENGFWKVGPKGLHDVHKYGDLTFDQVIIKSSNIGTVKIARLLGPAKLYRYIKEFGFGALTGLGLPGEVTGIIRHPKYWSKISINAIPIGQEAAATTMQVIRACAAIANGGYLVTPYMVSEIKDARGVTLKKFSPNNSKPFLKPETTQAMRDILTKVVAEGTGKSAQIPGILVAGKTGTSQKVDPKGGYSHSHFMATFVGFAPSDDPKLAMVVVLDDPRPIYYGGAVSAPVFKDVIEKSLLYLGVVPKEERKPSKQAA